MVSHSAPRPRYRGNGAPILFDLQKRLVRELRVDAVADHHGVEGDEHHGDALSVGRFLEAEIASPKQKHESLWRHVNETPACGGRNLRRHP